MIVPWTQEQIELLRKFYDEGRPFSIIADMINEATGGSFSRSAVIGRANRLGDLSPRIRGLAPSISRIPRAGAPLVSVLPPTLKPMRGDFLNITFDDLAGNHCRYIAGDGGLSATYCGQPKKEGSAYCAYCHSICYEPRPPKATPLFNQPANWRRKLAA